MPPVNLNAIPKAAWDSITAPLLDPLPELTFEEFCGVQMGYAQGYSAETPALRLYRNGAFGVQRVLYTKRNPRGGGEHNGWGIGKNTYYLDGDDNEYTEIEILYMAYMTKVAGLKPEDTLQGLYR